MDAVAMWLERPRDTTPEFSAATMARMPTFISTIAIRSSSSPKPPSSRSFLIQPVSAARGASSSRSRRLTVVAARDEAERVGIRALGRLPRNRRAEGHVVVDGVVLQIDLVGDDRAPDVDVVRLVEVPVHLDRALELRVVREVGRIGRALVVRP